MNKVLRFEITDKCNQNCDMCWSTSWKHVDMEWESVKKLIDDFASMYKDGIVVLTSREPLLSCNFKKTVDYATELGLVVKLLTNGTLLSEEMCDYITRSNIDFISISLHGDEEYHNKLVKSNNSYQRIIKGLLNLNKYKIKNNREDLEVRITTVINRNLLDSIEDVVNVAACYNTSLRVQHLMWHGKKVQKKHVEALRKRFGSDDSLIYGFPSSVDVNALEVLKILDRAYLLSKKKNVDFQDYPHLDNNKILEWYSKDQLIINDLYCDHVMESIRVRANGNVTLCQYIDENMGNVEFDSLDSIVNNYEEIAKELMDGKVFPICSRCCHVQSNDKIKVLNKRI